MDNEEVPRNVRDKPTSEILVYLDTVGLRDHLQYLPRLETLVFLDYTEKVTGSTSTKPVSKKLQIWRGNAIDGTQEVDAYVVIHSSKAPSVLFFQHLQHPSGAIQFKHIERHSSHRLPMNWPFSLFYKTAGGDEPDRLRALIKLYFFKAGLVTEAQLLQHGKQSFLKTLGDALKKVKANPYPGPAVQNSGAMSMGLTRREVSGKFQGPQDKHASELRATEDIDGADRNNIYRTTSIFPDITHGGRSPSYHDGLTPGPYRHCGDTPEVTSVTTSCSRAGTIDRVTRLLECGPTQGRPSMSPSVHTAQTHSLESAGPSAKGKQKAGNDDVAAELHAMKMKELKYSETLDRVRSQKRRWLDFAEKLGEEEDNIMESRNVCVAAFQKKLTEFNEGKTEEEKFEFAYMLGAMEKKKKKRRS